MIQTTPLIVSSLFALSLLLIGYYYRHKRAPEDFFMAGRKSGFVRILASTFTLIGAGEIVTLTAFAYIFGFSGISLFAGYLAGFVILAVFGKHLRQDMEKYKPYTVSDYLRFRLGLKSEKISIILSLIATVSLLVVQLVVGGLLIATLTGLTYQVALIIMATVIAGYLILGGFNSVLTTDVVQAVAMMLLAAFILLLYNPITTPVLDPSVAVNGAFSLQDFIVLFVVGTIAAAGAADAHQRVFAAKNRTTMQKGLVWAGIAIVLFGFLLIMLGLQIAAQFPDADPNNAFFVFLESALPTTLVSVLSIFLIASIFSTADSELFLSSILIGKLIKKKHTAEMESGTGQILMAGTMVVATLIAAFSTALVDIYFVLVYAFMIVGVVVIARFLNRGNDTLGFWGMTISLVLLGILIFTGQLTGWYPLLLTVPPLMSFLAPAKATA